MKGVRTDDEVVSNSGQPSVTQSTRSATRLDAMVLSLMATAMFALPLISASILSGLELIGMMVTLAMALIAAHGYASVFRTRELPRSPSVLAALFFPVSIVVSLAASPSGTGFILVLFGVIAGGVSLAVGSLDRSQLRNSVALPLLAASAIQTVLIIAQTLTDRAVGVSLFERGAELQVIDGLIRPQGIMEHVYEPAALALLAAGVAAITIPDRGRWRPIWMGGIFLCGVAIGLTHSRAALLGLLLMAICLGIAVVRRIDGAGTMGMAMLIGLVIAGALTAPSWVARADHSTNGNLDDMTLGRVTLVKQAVRMSLDHPILGVGPARYKETMREEYEASERYPFAVHNVSLLVAAENGIVASLILTSLVVWTAIRAIRAGPLAAALVFSISGFLMLDALHADRPIGVVMTGVWIGAMCVGTSASSRYQSGERLAHPSR